MNCCCAAFTVAAGSAIGADFEVFAIYFACFRIDLSDDTGKTTFPVYVNAKSKIVITASFERYSTNIVLPIPRRLSLLTT